MKQKILNRTRSFPRTWKLLLLLFVGFCGLGFQSKASHFRYHSVSWSMGTNDTVIFQVTQSWRWTAFGNPALNSVTPISSFTFGDGTATSYSLLITSINPTEDWFTGVTTIKHKYPANGTYIFQYSDCCRIGGLLDGNSGLSQLMQTSVTVGGTPQNNSPVTTVPAIVNFQLNTPNTFTIPGYDPDGDALTFSITPTANSGLNTSTPPGLTLSSAGVINWTPTVAGLSAFSVKITDSKGDYTTVDFILRSSTFTSNPPTFDYAVTPVNNFVYSVNPGTPINFNVKADDVDAGSQVVLSASGVPSGATFTPSLPTTAANPATTAFSWTPGMADIGSYVIAFTATDNNGQQAITNVVINVNTNPVFDVPPTPIAGSGFCVVVGNTLNQTIQAQNLLSGVNVSIASVAGLPAGAVHTPSLPTTPATYAVTNLSWAPTSADWGTHTATYTALDANNKTATHSFNVLVNSSPSFTSAMPPATAVVGVLYSHTFTGTDPDIPFGDVLSYHQTGLPSWLTLTDNGNGTATLSGTPTLADVGTHNFDVILEDIHHHCGPHIEQNITINVQNCNTSNTTSITACDSYFWSVDGNTYTQTGTYSFVTNVAGCIHTEILDLTINTTTYTAPQIETACDTYTWSVNGQTYTQSGTYTYSAPGGGTLFASNGGFAAGSTNPGAIMTVSPTTAAPTVVGTPSSGNGVTGIDFTSGGLMYGFLNSGVLVQLNPATGAILNTIGQVTLAGNPIQLTDMAIQPGTNVIYGTTGPIGPNSNKLVTVDPVTAVATFIGQPVPSGSFLAIAFNASGVLYGLQTNQSSGLLVIDPSLGTVISNTALSTSIGAVGLGCDKSTGLLYASECCQSTLGNALYTITPSGTTTYIGAMGGTNRVQDLAFQPGGSCPTISTLELTVIPSTSNTTTESACDSYTWSVNNVNYTQSGTYSVVNGCHTEILDLTITPSTSNTTTESACDSYTWSVNNVNYTQSGTYSVVNGCHTEILDLTITPSTSNTTTESACDSYTWSVNNVNYTQSGTYSVVNGCHTEILDLTITPSTSNTTTASACDSYIWSVDNVNYTQSGTYSVVNGCHTEILDLTITPSTTNTTTISACDSYSWSVNGTTYTQSGTYSVVTGCHTELLDLTITTLSLSTSSTDVTCFGAQNGTGTVSWGNSANSSFGFENGLTDWQTIGFSAVESNIGGVVPTHGSNMGIISTQGGQSDANIETFLGLTSGSISSIATDVVTTGSAFKRNITVSAGQTVTFNYNFMTQDYLPFNDLAFLSITGNSIQLLADVSTATNFNSVGPNIYSVVHQKNWSSYSYTFANAGTYSIGFGIMNLIDNGVPSLLAIDGGTSAMVSWSTSPVQTTNTATGLAPGTYTVTVTDGPCTSTATVVINEPAAITGSESQTACASFTWPANGTTYSNSGIYTAVVPAANGCDSTVTLNLTINPAPMAMAYDVSACASGAVTLLGTPAGGTFSIPNPYTGPTTAYTYTYTDANGCTTTSAPAMAYHSNAVPITGISSSNIGANTATINWNGVPGLLWYEVRYRLLGSASWTGGGTQAAPTTFKNLTGLDAASIYEIEVRGFCVQNQPGPWSATHVFQTGPACPAPQNLFETNVTQNAAKLNWSSVPGVNYYQIRYRTSAGPGAWVNGGTAPSSATSKVVTGLAANTAYDWQIRAICNPSPFSTGTWSALGDFMTLASKPGDVEEAVSTLDYAVTVYPNPTRENLSIELAAQQTQVTVVKLYDLSGRLVKQMQTQIEAGIQTITMNVSELSSGLYTIQVYANDQMVHTSKVNKQN